MTRLAFPTRLVSSLLAVLAIGFGSRLAAQDPEPDSQDEKGPSPVELARQIRRNMLKIEEELTKAGTHDQTRGEQVRKDLEELLDTMKRRQEQVVKDIDDIVKQFKSCSGGSGSSDSNENQKSSRPRDRNQSQGKPKPRDPNSGKEQAGKPKPKPKSGQKPSNKKGSGAEDNRAKEQDPGENQPGDPREELKPEKFAKINLNEIWGNLPPELRQKLVDRNFDDFTPEYKDQIAEYFKKTSSAPKN